MEFIHLNKGYITCIDDCDVAQLSFQWYVDISTDSRRYATRWVDGQHLRLHVAIMQPPEGFCVDHIDRNGLNNRRNNLRIATTSQNNANCLPRNGRRFKGAYWNKRDMYWYARIQHENKDHYLGIFPTEVDAAKAYNDAATRLFGEFARLNTFEELS